MEFSNQPDDPHFPLVIELEPGTYHWCACGGTAAVPWCDGSHAGTGVEPVAFEITEPRTHAICSCGITNTPPFCDNSHATAED
jgi:CDGSH-type Zn-finger protein